MIIPKNLPRLMKSQISGGRSRHSQLICQSSSILHSSSTGPLRNASSSAVRVAGALASSFDQSGLPVNRSASHQTSPASSASRSVSDIGGSTVRAQEKIGLVRKSRRRADELMKSSSVSKPHDQANRTGSHFIVSRVEWASPIHFALILKRNQAVTA